MTEIDLESGNLTGQGEAATLQILKYLTGLKLQSRKFFHQKNGIFKQIPVVWILDHEDLIDLSEPHKKGSIDLFIKTKTQKIAIRVQGKGHGQFLKGAGKAQHDKVQANMLKKHCEVVDVKNQECPQIFKEKVNELAIQEIRDAFKTARVLLPEIESHAQILIRKNKRNYHV
ncbi:MAG: hypothetical protein ABI340_04080 [Nitrososphaera sp.]|jgi:hypothetical protein